MTEKYKPSATHDGSKDFMEGEVEIENKTHVNRRVFAKILNVNPSLIKSMSIRGKYQLLFPERDSSGHILHPIEEIPHTFLAKAIRIENSYTRWNQVRSLLRRLDPIYDKRFYTEEWRKAQERGLIENVDLSEYGPVDETFLDE